jgi:hypothetical protein
VVEKTPLIGNAAAVEPTTTPAVEPTTIWAVEPKMRDGDDRLSDAPGRETACEEFPIVTPPVPRPLTVRLTLASSPNDSTTPPVEPPVRRTPCDDPTLDTISFNAAFAT